MSGASLIRRGMARTAEVGAVASFADLLGLFPSFSDLMANPQTALGAIFATMGVSALYDCIEQAIKPDLTADPCENSENDIP